MTGLFGTLNTATSGIRAQQTALQTIGHNVANSNTEGYSRQRVTMQTGFPQSVPGVGQVGTGVGIGSIDRVSDHFVTAQLRDAHSTTKRHESLSDTIGQLEAIFNEPSDTGLGNQISEVFNAWTYLASNPEQASARSMIVQTTETFTGTIHQMSHSMDALHNDTLNELDNASQNVNSTLEQLDALNHQIWQASVRGLKPNDLLDQQDRLISDIAGNVDISVERDEFNRVSIEAGGQTLLNRESRQELAVITERNDNGEFFLANGNQVNVPEGSEITLGSLVVTNQDNNNVTLINARTGSIRGSQDALAVIDEAQGELDGFARDFAKAVNLIHSNDGEGDPFFTIDDAHASSTIRVTDALRTNPENVVSGITLDNTYSGDGSRAQAIASLQNQSLVLDSDSWTLSDDGSMTIEGEGPGATLFSRYNSMVTGMGLVKQQEDNMLDTQNALMDLLTQRRESISGVDINEEVVDMIKFSSAFQANSRVLQTISEMIDTLINRTGV